MISIGRIDISVAVTTLSSFQELPCRGYKESAKSIVGYISKMKEGGIRCRTCLRDYSGIDTPVYDWVSSVYGEITEIITINILEALGNPMIFSNNFDKKFYHNKVTGHAVTGILHMISQTHIGWHAKKHPTSETSTYGSDFVAGRTCVDQIVDLRDTLRYLGVPIIKSYMFGDNKLMVD